MKIDPCKYWFVNAKYNSWSSTGTVSNWHDGVNNEKQIIEHLKRSAKKFGHTVKEFDHLEIRELKEETK